MWGSFEFRVFEAWEVGIAGEGEIQSDLRNLSACF